MNTHREPPPSRLDAWKGSAWYALLFAAVVLVILKMFTPLVFGAALGVAVLLFMFSFAFLMRITPKSGRQ
jgi:4-hydroxybenzoate polyprenyltransferase